MKHLILFMAGAMAVAAHHANAQYWAPNGNHIYNTNSGDVQITRSLVLNGNQTGYSEIRFGSSTGEIISSKRTATGNQFGLDFYTDSKNRLSITNDGNVDFYENNIGNSTIRLGSGGGEVILSKRTAGGNQFGLDFNTNSINRLSITNGGNIGIGTSSPAALLTVMGSESTVHGKKSGIQLTNTAPGGKNWYIRAGATGTGTPKGGFSIADDIAYRLAIDTSGNVGIGTLTPFRTLQVDGNARFASASGVRYLEFYRYGTGANQKDFRFEHTGNALIVTASVNDFGSVCNVARFGTCSDTYKLTVYGSAFASGGNWVSSDIKLKKNVDDVSNAMNIIKQLKPKTYFYKTGDYLPLNLPDSKQYGFIAQELEKVLPNLVQSSDQPVSTDAKGVNNMEELKAINYTSLIPLLTKAIQEQQQQIEKLQQQIDDLKQVISAFTKGQSPISNADAASSKINTSVTSAMMEQNNPNPFLNNTSIRYYVPEQCKNAQLVITDQAGKTVKQLTLSQGKGVVNMDASAFSSGIYYYSLVADGKKVDTKKMLLAK